MFEVIVYISEDICERWTVNSRSEAETLARLRYKEWKEELGSCFDPPVRTEVVSLLNVPDCTHGQSQ